MKQDCFAYLVQLERPCLSEDRLVLWLEQMKRLCHFQHRYETLQSVLTTEALELAVLVFSLLHR